MTEPLTPPTEDAPPTEVATTDTEAPVAAAVVLPPERIGRGALLALAAIPVGVIAWVLIWQFGFISAIVAFGVVVAAAFLYRLGSGGRVGTIGLAIIVAITIVTLVVAFFAGIAVEMANVLGYVLPASLSDPAFWDDFAYNVFDNPAMWEELTMSIVMTVVFAALGMFGVVRRLAKEARATA